MNYLYLPTCVNATSVSVMSDRIYLHFTSRCMYTQIHDINNVKLIIIMKLL